MSYESTRPALRRYGARRPQAAMGGTWYEDAAFAILGVPGAAYVAGKIGEIQNAGCLQTADAQANIRAIDARITALSKDWQPSGYYTPDDMGLIIATTILPASIVMNQLALAPHTTSDSADTIAQFSSNIRLRLDQSQAFNQAVIAARAAGADVIDAPGLRRWVIGTMMDMAAAMAATYVLYCNLTMLDTLANWLRKLEDLLRSLKDAAVDALKTIYHLPDTIGTMITFAKWGLVVTAAYLVYNEIEKRRK